MAAAQQKKELCPFCNNHKLSDPCSIFKDRGQIAFDGPNSLFLSKETTPLRLDNMTKEQKFWHYTGKILAAIMAVGCGVSTAAAFIGLNLITAGAASVIIAAGIFIATALTNWYIFKTAAPEVLINLFARKWSEDILAPQGGCDLISMNEADFNHKTLKFLSTSAYVYCHASKKLYYFNKNSAEFNKNTNECKPILDFSTASEEEIATFKKRMNIDVLKANRAVRLSSQGIKEIQTITGHNLISEKRKYMVLGLIFALSVGVTFGALSYASTYTLTAAFGFLAAISPAFPPIAIALAIGNLVCLTALMFKDIVELIKAGNPIQTCGKFIKNLLHTGTRTTLITMDSEPTSKSLKDVEFNAGYVRVTDKLYYFNKETNTKTLLKNDPSKIGINDINWNTQNNKEIDYDLLRTITDKTGQPTQYKIQTMFARGLAILFTAAFIPLAIIGLFMTQNACAPGVKEILNYIPKASAAAVNICAYIICFGFAFIGQIPFTVATAVKTISTWPQSIVNFATTVTEAAKAFFTKQYLKDKAHKNIKLEINHLEEKRQLSTMENLQLFGLYTMAFFNAVGNGFISMSGGIASVFIQALSWAAGWWNSVTAGFSAARSAFNDYMDEPTILKLYQAQENRHFWRTVGMVTGAIVLTPLSLLLTYNRWQQARKDDQKIRRDEISTEKYEATRQKKHDTYTTHKVLTNLFSDEETAKPHKLKKLVIDSADFKTKIVYWEVNQKQRFDFFQNRASSDQLNPEEIQKHQDSIAESERFVATALSA